MYQDEDPYRLDDIAAGFNLQALIMKDAESGLVLWESDWQGNVFNEELEAVLPEEILACKAVSREIIFTSKEAIRKFRLEQNVILQGVTIEHWRFDFGFVMPNSSNSWDQVVLAESEDKMLPAQLLSGNLVIESLFYDGDELIATNNVRVFYE